MYSDMSAGIIFVNVLVALLIGCDRGPGINSSSMRAIINAAGYYNLTDKLHVMTEISLSHGHDLKVVVEESEDRGYFLAFLVVFQEDIPAKALLIEDFSDVTACHVIPVADQDTALATGSVDIVLSYFVETASKSSRCGVFRYYGRDSSLDHILTVVMGKPRPSEGAVVAVQRSSASFEILPVPYGRNGFEQEPTQNSDPLFIIERLPSGEWSATPVGEDDLPPET